MGLFDFIKKAPRLSDDIIIAADKGDTYAEQKLDLEFDRGLTSEEHNNLRKKAYYPLAISGDANAQYWMGFLALYIDKNASQALSWYEKAANQGNTEAMLALALGYSEFINDPDNSYAGYIGFGYDASKERFWKLKAAECGDSQAQVDLALDYSIDGEVENALKMYQKATNSNDCKILMRAYKGLADIYGNSLDAQNHNVSKQKECLIRVLEMKQNNLHDMGAYDETYYASAAFSLGSIFMREYESTKDTVKLKHYVYCFSLAYIAGQTFAKEYITKSNYQISDFEWSNWQRDAKTLSFHLPQ